MNRRVLRKADPPKPTFCNTMRPRFLKRGGGAKRHRGKASGINSGGVTSRYWKHLDQHRVTMSGKLGVKLTIPDWHKSVHFTRDGRLTTVRRCLQINADAMLPRVRTLFTVSNKTVSLQRIRLGGCRFALAHSGSGDDRERKDGDAAWRHRCSGASCRAFASGWTL